MSDIEDQLSPLRGPKPSLKKKNMRKSILDRVEGFEKRNDNERYAMEALVSPDLVPKEKVGSASMSAGVGRRNKRVSMAAMIPSPGLDKSDHGKMKFAKERESLLKFRAGSVYNIKTRFNEVEEENERAKQDWESKEERKKRYRRNPKKRKKKAKTEKSGEEEEEKPSRPAPKRGNLKSSRSGITKEMMATEVWKEVKAKSITIDPSTFQAPKNLQNPTPKQQNLIQKAMDECLVLQGKEIRTNKDLLHAFEAVDIQEGTELDKSGEGNFFYVVEKGELDFKIQGKTVGTVKEGDTFGELDLIYDGENMSDIVASTDDAKVIRLDQNAFRGIVQFQTKQDEEQKRHLLRKVPFLRDLLYSKQTGNEINKDTTNRLCSIMKSRFYNRGDVLVTPEQNPAETLFMVQDGTIELTSDKKDKFVLGKEAYVGKKAIMGVANKGEPNVATIVGHGDGKIFTIDASDVDKVLGKNYFSRQACRAKDRNKLAGFECVKSIDLDPKTMADVAEKIVDKPFTPDTQVLEQGVETEPCLYFVREGAVILSTRDGKMRQRVGAGGYFGVEQLLAPKGSGAEAGADIDAVKIPAQWTVTVEGDAPCLCGVLPLKEIQSHLDAAAADEADLDASEHMDTGSAPVSPVPVSPKPKASSKIDPAEMSPLPVKPKSSSKLDKPEKTSEEKATASKKAEKTPEEKAAAAERKAAKEAEKARKIKEKKEKKKKQREKEKAARKKKQKVDEADAFTNAIVKQRQERRDVVQKSITFDDLELISVLGDGQFGEVWLVKTEVEGKEESFALKRQTKKEEDLKSIKRELKVTQELTTSHPFIVDLVHTFENEDSIDMLMGLISGGELWDVVHREEDDGNWTSGIPEDNARFYALVIADTLNYMHDRKYVFRDLKPENVMIDGDGYPVIVDFGFAKICEEMTFTFCGTPNYVAPEIIKNTGHNRSVDLWALGIVIYEMIGGEHPFYVDGMDNMAVFESICKEPHYPLTKVKEDVSADAVALIDGLLEKDSSQRLGMLARRAADVLGHQWFAPLNLEKIRQKKIKAPWIPPQS